MARSKKNIIIFIIIVISLLAIALLAIFKSKNQNLDTNRVSKIYQKIVDNTNFTFIMQERSEDIVYELSMAKSGDNFSIDTNLDDEHTTTLVLGNQIYYLMHDSQEYYALEEDDEYVDLESEIYIVENGLKEITKKEYVSGKEEIDGKTYYYEEYDNDNLDFILFADINETSKVRTRFYFEGENLIYIKHLVTNEEGKTEELININLKYESDENLFKIPEDYAEAED